MNDYSRLTPELAAFLEARYSSGLPEVWQAPISTSRFNSFSNLKIRGELTSGVDISHRFITGPSSDLPIRIYRPHGYKSLPTVVFFHGGGWVLNNLDTYDVALSNLAKSGPFTVVAVNYQKAPEHPFPTPFNDCYATLEWAINNSELLGTSRNAHGELMVGVMGDSAGANLAAAVAIKDRDEQLHRLKFQVLLYPCNDSTLNFASAMNNREGFGLSTKGMEWFWGQYLNTREDHSNPYAVPSRSKDLSNTAPAIVITVEFDPLLDDGYNYAQMLKSSGVPTFYREIEGAIHGIFNLNGVTSLSGDLQNMIANEINSLLTQAR